LSVQAADGAAMKLKYTLGKVRCVLLEKSMTTPAIGPRTKCNASSENNKAVLSSKPCIGQTDHKDAVLQGRHAA